MKTHLRCLLLTLSLLFTAGCEDSTSDPEVEHQVERSFGLDNCSTVELRGAVQLTIKNGAQPRVVLRGQPAQLDALQVDETADRALLDYSAGKDVHQSSGGGMQVTLFCSALRHLQLLDAVQAEDLRTGEHQMMAKVAAYGRSSFTSSSLAAEQLDIRASGSSRVEVPDVVAEEIQVLASGVSVVLVGGESPSINVDTTGQAKLDATALRVQDATVNIRETSHVSLRVTAHLAGQVRDTATLAYNGAPDVALETDPAAQIQSTPLPPPFG